MKQTDFRFRTWGGKRQGAGRPARKGLKRLRHERRPLLAKQFPVHVTWRVRREVWKLRTHRCFAALSRAFWQGCNRFGFRLVHYSVQGNHMHLIVEANGEKSLAKGMTGLGVRVARGLNRVMGRTGQVLDERYHGHILEDTDGSEERPGVPAHERAQALRARRGRSVHVEDAVGAAGDVPPSAAVLTSPARD